MTPDEQPWTTAQDDALRSALAAVELEADEAALAEPAFVRAAGDRMRRRRMLAWTAAAAVAVVGVAGVGFAVTGRADDRRLVIATPSTTATASPSPDTSSSPTSTPTSTPTATPTGSAAPSRTPAPKNSVTPPPPVSTSPVTRSCPTVVFTPNSGDGAYQVRATNVTCDEAESLIRAVDEENGYPTPSSIDVDGWHCTSEAVVPGPKYVYDWRCVRGADRVSWQRS
ncbi:hypothetical protein [uncultured Phycicoccus sp.]|uniref:hypothetical protein n=1 Tax=uncultured Phycicoccus sp. TaxID=661422 RepID=UPI00260C08CA|nr:hypothetical protein [uncultured Phycicoccus sp.]